MITNRVASWATHAEKGVGSSVLQKTTCVMSDYDGAARTSVTFKALARRAANVVLRALRVNCEIVDTTRPYACPECGQVVLPRGEAE